MKLQVRVLDSATGQSEWDSGLTQLPAAPDRTKPSIPASARLPLDALTAGSYRLEIRASDAAGNQASRTADFVVQ
jgi:hypothetical protein